MFIFCQKGKLVPVLMSVFTHKESPKNVRLSVFAKKAFASYV